MTGRIIRIPAATFCIIKASGTGEEIFAAEREFVERGTMVESAKVEFSIKLTQRGRRREATDVISEPQHSAASITSTCPESIAG